MRNIPKKIIPALSAFALGLLGFAGCKGGLGLLPREEEGDWNAYGTPTCDFKIEITVTDEEGGALKDIKVIPAGVRILDYSNGMRRSQDTLSTDVNGKVAGKYNYFPCPEKIMVYFEDMDKDLNGGSFARDSAEFFPVQTKERKGWYTGEFLFSGTKTLKKQ